LSRRQLLKSSLYGGLAAAAPAPSLAPFGCSKRYQSKRPNIIFILIDSLRDDRTGLYEFALRRWCKELDRPISEIGGALEEEPDYEVLTATDARLKVADFDQGFDLYADMPYRNQQVGDISGDVLNKEAITC
jgi:hypothetical protein